jgi:hypothetical protein
MYHGPQAFSFFATLKALWSDSIKPLALPPKIAPAGLATIFPDNGTLSSQERNDLEAVVLLIEFTSRF